MPHVIRRDPGGASGVSGRFCSGPVARIALIALPILQGCCPQVKERRWSGAAAANPQRVQDLVELWATDGVALNARVLTIDLLRSDLEESGDAACVKILVTHCEDSRPFGPRAPLESGVDDGSYQPTVGQQCARVLGGILHLEGKSPLLGRYGGSLRSWWLSNRHRSLADWRKEVNDFQATEGP